MNDAAETIQPPASPPDSDISTIVIEPRVGWQPIDLREIWHYRDLLFFLALRDITVRYKQTALGAAWAIIQPLTQMFVFTIIFGKFGNMAGDSPIPYPVRTFCALVPWGLFASALTQAGNSLIGSQNLISKVYFPRLIIPLSSILSSLVDFAIAFVVLIIMMLWYGVYPHWGVLLLPLFIVQAIVAALSVGLWLSALNVEYRDVRYTIPFLTQIWLLATPVAYLSDRIPEQWRAVAGLNPMAGVVEGFRWALLGTGNPPGGQMIVSSIITVLLLVGGLFYFRRVEKTFADIV